MYKLKHISELHWFDLEKIEHPRNASRILSSQNLSTYPADVFQFTDVKRSISVASALDIRAELELRLINDNYFLVALSQAERPVISKLTHERHATNAKDFVINDPLLPEAYQSKLINLIKTVPAPVVNIVRTAPDSAPNDPVEKPQKATPEKATREPKEEQNWIKIQSMYDDLWKTPLPLTVTVSVNDETFQQGVALNEGSGKNSAAMTLRRAQDTSNEKAVLLLEDMPDGDVKVEVDRVTGLEQEIAGLKNELQIKLDSAYRNTVEEMKEFQEQWDRYGYASIAISGAEGVFVGGATWLKDQADLFEWKTWKSLGEAISDGASKAWDMAADYAPEAYEKIVGTVQEQTAWLDDNSDNITSWNWWVSQGEKAYSDTKESIGQHIDNAEEFLNESKEFLEKLIKHKNEIQKLPQYITAGDAKKVQKFVEVVLFDLDPELAEQIKQSDEFHIVLELIADHEAALTYFAYLDLFFEAVPPNFYAYISGKGGAYVAVEVLLLVAVSFISLGAGTAARIATLAAKLASHSARAANTMKKLKRAQKAIEAFKNTIEEFSDCTDTLKKLGEKLSKTRSAGRFERAPKNGTITMKKKSVKRDARCRVCKSEKHSTPKSSRGILVYR